MPMAVLCPFCDAEGYRVVLCERVGNLATIKFHRRENSYSVRGGELIPTCQRCGRVSVVSLDKQTEPV